MKVESLVIVYQNDTVNTFPGLVHTARHTRKPGALEEAEVTARGQVSMVNLVIGVKS